MAPGYEWRTRVWREHWIEATAAVLPNLPGGYARPWDAYIGMLIENDHYAPSRTLRRWFIWKGLASLGIPWDRLQRLDPNQVYDEEHSTLEQIFGPEDQVQRVEAWLEAHYPEPPEPHRVVEAYHKVGELVTDNSAGRPQRPDGSAIGSQPARGHA